MMSRLTIRPAQGYDLHPIQAMSCSGDGHSCYPSFVRASHQFFVADNGGQIIGFICAHPDSDRQGTRCISMMEPYLYTSQCGKGIEDQLRAAVLEWAEQRLDIHFFKEDSTTLRPIKPHEYIQSLKHIPAIPEPEDSTNQETPAPQRDFTPA